MGVWVSTSRPDAQAHTTHRADATTRILTVESDNADESFGMNVADSGGYMMLCSLTGARARVSFAYSPKNDR